MKQFIHCLSGSILGFTVGLFMFLNTVFILPFILILAFIKLIPILLIKKFCQYGLNFVCDYWVFVNNVIAKYLVKIKLDVQKNMLLSNKKSYIVISNHQSWLDIIILQSILHAKVPALKFFLKESLRWVPILGMCWWALDFPFMKRYSKAYLEKHPKKKGNDIKATIKACAKFKVIPVAIMNYPEGTRFTKAKHQKQNSSFSNLLKPKAGGIALALPVLGKSIDSILDVSVVYPNEPSTFWDFLCGRVSTVRVDLRKIDIPEEFYEMDYINDLNIRNKFQHWFNSQWQDKNKIISNLKDKN